MGGKFCRFALVVLGVLCYFPRRFAGNGVAFACQNVRLGVPREGNVAMKTTWLRSSAITVLLASCMGTPASAELPNLIPFRRIEVDPGKSYELNEKHGPWLVVASSFAGEGAEKQAHDLVLEIRKEYKLPAYVHKQHFDFTESLDGMNGRRQKTQLKYASAVSFDEIAVLVGNFSSIDDPALEKTLKTIKHAQPKALDLTQNKNSTQRFTGYKALWKALTPKEEPKNRGPMRNAFATCNPLLRSFHS